MINKGEKAGRAIIYNQDASFKIIVHDIDHIELTFKKNKTSVTETVKEFQAIHKKLENTLKFARDDTLGYITARPYDLGLIEIEIVVELKDLQTMG